MSCKYDQIEALFLTDPFRIRRNWYGEYYRNLALDLIIQLSFHDTAFSINFKLANLIKKNGMFSKCVLDIYVEEIADKIKKILDAP